MLLTPRLAAYLFKIGQKVHRKEYVSGLLKCPECDIEVVDFTQEQADQHVVIKQDLGKGSLYYVVVGCEGYWTVNPETLGLPKGNWMSMLDQITK